jgi:diguanylate cyclase (GGDEF)-like protein/PAS domain S-box-containing protein
MLICRRHVRATADTLSPMAESLAAGGNSTAPADEGERLRRVIEAAPNAMVMIDQAGLIRLVNSQTEKLFGYGRSELLGSPVEMLVPQRARGHHEASRQGYFAEPNTRAMGAGRDLYGLRKDGSEVPIEIGLNPLQMPDGLFVLASIIDITERKRAEQRLRLVIEAAPSAMLMTDADGKIVLVNSQTEKLFGYDRADLLGHPVDMLVPERLRGRHDGYRRGYFNAPDTRAMGAGRDLYGLRKDGSEVPIEIGLNPLQMPDGLFVLASIIDITERKRAEERLRLVIEAAPNAMLMTNARGEIVLVNTQTEKLFGYTREELLRLTVEALIPLRFRVHHQAFRDAFFARPDTRAMGAGRELYGLRKDGGEIPIEIGLNPLQTEDGTFVLASVIDISERLQAERTTRAAAADRLRQSILDSLPFAVIATDLDGRILTANPAAARLLGYERHELVGQSVLLMHDSDELRRRAEELSHQTGMEILANFQVIVASGSQTTADEREWTYVRKDDTRLPVNIAITAMRDDSGKVHGFLKVAYDITERKRTESVIRHMAHHDALTGLPNRALLLDRLQIAIGQARRRGGRLALLILDIDYFKRINDSLGHLVGDRLLLAVSRRLQQRVRRSDTVARLGGDEFVILLSEATSREALMPLINQIAAAIAAPIQVDDHELLVSSSIGGCMFPDDGDDPTTLLKRADTAMYHAKSVGRSNFQWFAQSMEQESRERLALGTALRKAIESNELAVHYQPQVSLVDGRVSGIEALARWHSQQWGEVSPERFVPVAEEGGLILPLGEWVLRTACSECSALQQALGRHLTLAVNVSPRQFQQADWPQVVARALADSGLPPQDLELEITEGMLMQNPEESIARLQALRELGAAIVVDDFGTGYSSLSYLTRFPIDKLKIDRSFVRDLAADAADAAVINAIIAMAHSLDIRVVAEGVETEQQQRYLEQRDCDQAQGFLYSIAVPMAQIDPVIRKIESSTAP